MTDRLLKAVRYVEDNLDAPISARDIADVAGYSLYHFCRLFQAATGESVMSYVRKRRLSVAADALMSGSTERLIELALQVGFDSQAAFTRAFKAQFGVTPGRLRGSTRTWLPFRRLPIDAYELESLKENVSMKPRLISHDDIRIAYVSDKVSDQSDTDNNKDGTPTWRRFRPLIDTVGCRIGEHTFGVVEVVDKDSGVFCYSAAVEISDDGTVKDPLMTKTLEGGRFAVFTHTLASQAIGDELKRTFRYIYGTWLPQSGEKLRAYYDLEYYDSRFNPRDLSGTVEIWVPIR